MAKRQNQDNSHHREAKRQNRAAQAANQAERQIQAVQAAEQQIPVANQVADQAADQAAISQQPQQQEPQQIRKSGRERKIKFQSPDGGVAPILREENVQQKLPHYNIQPTYSGRYCIVPDPDKGYRPGSVALGHETTCEQLTTLINLNPYTDHFWKMHPNLICETPDEAIWMIYDSRMASKCVVEGCGEPDLPPPDIGCLSFFSAVSKTSTDNDQNEQSNDSDSETTDSESELEEAEDRKTGEEDDKKTGEEKESSSNKNNTDKDIKYDQVKNSPSRSDNTENKQPRRVKSLPHEAGLRKHVLRDGLAEIVMIGQELKFRRGKSFETRYHTYWSPTFVPVDWSPEGRGRRVNWAKWTASIKLNRIPDISLRQAVDADLARMANEPRLMQPLLYTLQNALPLMVGTLTAEDFIKSGFIKWAPEKILSRKGRTWKKEMEDKMKECEARYFAALDPDEQRVKEFPFPDILPPSSVPFTSFGDLMSGRFDASPDYDETDPNKPFLYFKNTATGWEDQKKILNDLISKIALVDGKRLVEEWGIDFNQLQVLPCGSRPLNAILKGLGDRYDLHAEGVRIEQNYHDSKCRSSDSNCPQARKFKIRSDIKGKNIKLKEALQNNFKSRRDQKNKAKLKCGAVHYFASNFQLVPNKNQPIYLELSKLGSILGLCDPSADAGVSLLYPIDGINVSQLYIKGPFQYTACHQENSDLISININIGHGDCLWWCVDKRFQWRLDQLLRENGLTRSNPYQLFGKLSEDRVPVFVIRQRPGQMITIPPGMLHYVISEGHTANLAWNVTPFHRDTIGAMIRSVRENALYQVKSVVPVVSILLHLARHFINGELENPVKLKDLVSKDGAQLDANGIEIDRETAREIFLFLEEQLKEDIKALDAFAGTSHFIKNHTPLEKHMGEGTSTCKNCQTTHWNSYIYFGGQRPIRYCYSCACRYCPKGKRPETYGGVLVYNYTPAYIKRLVNVFFDLATGAKVLQKTPREGGRTLVQMVSNEPAFQAKYFPEKFRKDQISILSETGNSIEAVDQALSALAEEFKKEEADFKEEMEKMNVEIEHETEIENQEPSEAALTAAENGTLERELLEKWAVSVGEENFNENDDPTIFQSNKATIVYQKVRVNQQKRFAACAVDQVEQVQEAPSAPSASTNQNVETMEIEDPANHQIHLNDNEDHNNRNNDPQINMETAESTASAGESPASEHLISLDQTALPALALSTDVPIMDCQSSSNVGPSSPLTSSSILTGNETAATISANLSGSPKQLTDPISIHSFIPSSASQVNPLDQNNSANREESRNRNCGFVVEDLDQQSEADQALFNAQSELRRLMPPSTTESNGTSGNDSNDHNDDIGDHLGYQPSVNSTNLPPSTSQQKDEKSMEGNYEDDTFRNDSPNDEMNEDLDDIDSDDLLNTETDDGMPTGQSVNNINVTQMTGGPSASATSPDGQQPHFSSSSSPISVATTTSSFSTPTAGSAVPGLSSEPTVISSPFLEVINENRNSPLSPSATEPSPESIPPKTADQNQPSPSSSGESSPLTKAATRTTEAAPAPVSDSNIAALIKTIVEKASSVFSQEPPAAEAMNELSGLLNILAFITKDQSTIAQEANALVNMLNQANCLAKNLKEKIEQLQQ